MVKHILLIITQDGKWKMYCGINFKDRRADSVFYCLKTSLKISTTKKSQFMYRYKKKTERKCLFWLVDDKIHDDDFLQLFFYVKELKDLKFV